MFLVKGTTVRPSGRYQGDYRLMTAWFNAQAVVSWYECGGLSRPMREIALALVLAATIRDTVFEDIPVRDRCVLAGYWLSESQKEGYRKREKKFQETMNRVARLLLHGH